MRSIDRARTTLVHASSTSPGHSAGGNGRTARRGATVFALVAVMLVVIAPAARARVLLGSADSFGVLAGSTITNTGDSVITGGLGLSPGTAVTGFPPGLVNGAQHVSDAVALSAKTALTTAYLDAAGRAFTATSPPDIGGRTLTPGVYRTGSVPSLGLTGNLTLNAQGNPDAVFIFQIESALTTATASSVTLINGAQACRVFWQVGSSATLGTTTAFQGTILALHSISVSNGVTVQGRLLARNGAVTLINDTITRPECAAATTPGTTPPGTTPGTTTPGTTTPGTTTPGTTTPGTTTPGTTTGPPAGVADRRGPLVSIVGLPGLAQPPAGTPRPPAASVCTTTSFSAQVRLSDRAGIKSARVYLDGKLVRRSTLTRVSLRISVKGLAVGPHRVTVVAFDRAGNRSSTTRRFAFCSLTLAAPVFTG